MNRLQKYTHPIRICPAVLFSVLFGLAVGISGCSGKKSLQMEKEIPTACKSTKKSEPVSVFPVCLNLRGRQLKAEISHLEKRLSDTPKDMINPQMNVHLAFLYSSPHNPAPDYGKALNQIRVYTQTAPESMKTNFDRYISRLLLEIETRRANLEKHKKKIKQMEKSQHKLKSEYGQLLQENKNLTQVIEKLKNLNIRLEAKRKSIE